MLGVRGTREPEPEGLIGKSGGEQRGGDARETRLGSRGPAVEGRASRGQCGRLDSCEQCGLICLSMTTWS